MRVVNDYLNGIKLIEGLVFHDERGAFIKTFSDCSFKNLGITTSIKEFFYSISKKNVIRGMHFQVPPHEHDKLVFVVKGKIIDVVLDLRVNSKTYGLFEVFRLHENDGKVIYIPKGFAHGFRALEDNTIVAYLTSKEHSPEFDSGIRWDSFGYDWELDNEEVIVSKKDSLLTPFNEFKSPFR